MRTMQRTLILAGIGFFLLAVFGSVPLARAQNQAITFSATGDVPYEATEVTKFQQQLANHNKYSPSAFFVHLGDIFHGGEPCDDSHYATMANMLKSLTVPVYIIPGDNETIDCASLEQALSLWKQYFLNYERNFCGATATEHASAPPENFAFTMHGVLFVAINLVGGTSPYQQDAEWVAQQFQAKGAQVRAAVVFSHAGPDKSSKFSTPFRSALAAFGKPVLFLHGHGHSWLMDNPFPETNLLRVQVDNGGAEDPVEVTVTLDTSTPATAFALKRNPWSSKTVVNMPPCVNAGPDQTLGASSSTATLQGQAVDDGDPNGSLTTTWSKLNGPGAVAFGNFHALATTASFGAAGTYILRLTADDGALQKSDDVTIVVNGGNSSSYSLSMNTSGSGTVDLNPPGGVYNSGTTVTLTATPAAGFQFSGWSGDLTGSTNPTTITMNANKIVTATFTGSSSSGAIVHEETQTGGSTQLSSVSTSANLTAVSGQLYLAAISTRPRVVVTGVSGLGLSWTLVKAQCSGGNATGVEVWMAQGTPGGNGAVTATFGRVDSNAVIAVSRYSGVHATAPIGSIISGNTNGSGGACTGGIANSAYSFNLTTTVANAQVYGAVGMRTKTHTPGAGYTERAEFKQGTLGNTASIAVEDKNVAAASTVTVDGTFNAIVDWAMVGVEIKPGSGSLTQRTLTVSTVGSGSVGLNPAGGTYNDGTVVTLTATPAAGYQFSGWSGALSGSTNPATITMNANKSVTATFTAVSPSQFTLTANTVGSGSVSLNPTGGVYNSGTVVTLTATPAAGFQFSGWSGALTGSTNPATITMNANKSVTATFTAIQRTLTVNTVGSGSVALNPAGGTYNDGTVVTLTATPAAGFQFSGWSGALTGSTNPATITMDANKSVTATFTASGGTAPNTNLAKSKPITASSTYTDKPATNAVDGSTSTYWRSGDVSSSNPIVWLRVDLGSAQTVARVIIRWKESYYAKSYELQISNDDVNWTKVYTTTAGASGSQQFVFSPITARYVRFYMTLNGKSNYQIYELEVYSGAAAKSAHAVAELPRIPTEVLLERNYPNPFNPATAIFYSLPEGMHTTLKIYNFIGQEVANLVNGYQEAGRHEVIFNASKLPSGNYFAVLQAGDEKRVRRITLMK